jgi:dTDP-4-dehydrorhamnose reductase
MSVKVLVTGANGQLGRTIQELYDKNHLGIDFKFVSKKELDITNKEEVASFFKKKPFDFCINCAAYTNVEQAEKTPEIAYRVNADGVKYLAVSCNETNTILIHISTDYVFDGEKGAPYLPNDLTNPINEYGKSKLLGEQYIQEIMSKFFIIRTSWLYSKKYGKNFYRTILDLAKTKDELAITTNQIGCPTNTESLSKFIIDLLANKSTDYGIKHFSDNQVMTWYDFANEILLENNLNGNTSLVKGNNYVTFARRPKYSVLLNSNNSNPKDLYDD